MFTVCCREDFRAHHLITAGALAAIEATLPAMAARPIVGRIALRGSLGIYSRDNAVPRAELDRLRHEQKWRDWWRDGGVGGSYLASLFTDPVLTAGVNRGDGSINIELLKAVPEPSTWAMMLAGFAGLGWLARTRGRKTSPV
jgi:hypothetical protein